VSDDPTRGLEVGSDRCQEEYAAHQVHKKKHRYRDLNHPFHSLFHLQVLQEFAEVPVVLDQPDQLEKAKGP
jgi:hypothetical protein